MDIQNDKKQILSNKKTAWMIAGFLIGSFYRFILNKIESDDSRILNKILHSRITGGVLIYIIGIYSVISNLPSSSEIDGQNINSK